VAVGKRLAAAQRAWICFEDEAGQTLQPPKARTWGRRGQTPIVTVTGKGSDRVSMAGLLCLAPGRRGWLMFRTITHRGRKGERSSFTEADYIALLDAAHRTLGTPIVLCWDNLNTHTSKAMRALIDARDWLTVIRLPAYAPDLNPARAPGRTSNAASPTSPPTASTTSPGPSKQNFARSRTGQTPPPDSSPKPA
jgi:putative transposase